MSKIISTTRSKWIYVATIIAFLIGLIFVVCEILSVGCILCGLAIGFAYSNAKASGHIPNDKTPSDNG
jgi:hypothetical protein